MWLPAVNAVALMPWAERAARPSRWIRTSPRGRPSSGSMAARTEADSGSPVSATTLRTRSVGRSRAGPPSRRPTAWFPSAAPGGLSVGPDSAGAAATDRDGRAVPAWRTATVLTTASSEGPSFQSSTVALIPARAVRTVVVGPLGVVASLLEHVLDLRDQPVPTRIEMVAHVVQLAEDETRVRVAEPFVVLGVDLGEDATFGVLVGEAGGDELVQASVPLFPGRVLLGELVLSRGVRGRGLGAGVGRGRSLGGIVRGRL